MKNGVSHAFGLHLEGDLTVSRSEIGTVRIRSRGDRSISVDFSSLKILLASYSGKPGALFNWITNDMEITLKGRPFLSQSRKDSKTVRRLHPIRFFAGKRS